MGAGVYKAYRTSDFAEAIKLRDRMRRLNHRVVYKVFDTTLRSYIKLNLVDDADRIQRKVSPLIMWLSR